MAIADKVILITGASTGIGRALAFEYARENCLLVLAARRTELIEQYRSGLNIDAEKLLIIKCDVSKKTDVAAAYEMTKKKFGRIDIAILNAGIGHAVDVKNYNSIYAEETLGANLFGLIYWIEQLLPDMLKRKGGVIAGISSLADNRGFSGSGFYCASKAAASVYLEGLRIELKKYSIKVITVKPGFVKTPMTDKNKFKMPLLMPVEKAAAIIKEGISKNKRIIQFPWQMVLLTRLVGLLPGSIYERLAGLSNK